jgi:hypothetical protein
MSGRGLVAWLSQTAIILLGFSTFFVGCSRQSEGERCDQEAAGDTDCNEGLVCIRCDLLRSGGIDRCCPLDPNAHTDADCDRADMPRLMSECQQATATGGSGGLGGRGGASGAGGSGATSGAGGSGATSGAGGSGATSGSGGEAGAGEPAGAGGQ